jgi:hypothetical protein
MSTKGPITILEAAEAVYDMVGTAANIANPITALDWHLHAHRFTVTLAREHNGTHADHRNFVVEVHANEPNPVLSPEVKDVQDDMAVLADEAGLLLLHATGMDHDNKRDLINILKMLRGQQDTGWTIDTEYRKMQRKKG